ncbi:6,7-dimethyl-8-ribityllumazine synthase, partial [Escherichia coli]|uniref:6,7-dimethyl-8-ribityllumazine synthase n=1 Tax=Escherichia coli TaxID=562 RepID=UPI003004B3D5
MLHAEKGTAQQLNGQGLRIGMVQARWNESITNSLANACHQELLTLGVKAEAIDHVMATARRAVHAAIQAMAEGGAYDDLVAIGRIIRGTTYHFELVANESGAGVTRVSLDYKLPIANAITNTENLEQAIARQTEKGLDAARVAVEMAS